jgi:acetyl coenzyme A synthetase (ADP forming)-like protein
MSKDLQGLFSPKSVCVIGASRSTEKVGGIILKNIIDSKFAGKIYPINPNTQSIYDLPCFADLESLPEIPELAIVAIPASLVLDELEHIGKKGIKNVVVLSSGFKEAGVEGERLEKDLIDISKKYGFNLLGPNCMGFVNNSLPINATFGQSSNQASGGNLRFITQSGAIASSIFDWCNKTGLGFAEFVTLGNKAVLNENDVLEYFYSGFQKTDSGPHPIGLYLESISDGPEFLKIAGDLSRTHPVFIIKAGRTKEAAKAIHSHTGSIAGEDSVIEAAFEQTDVIRCQTLEEFFDISRSFAWGNALTGPKVAIVSNAGGPAVICADAVVNEGLTLSEFDDATKEQLKSCLPHFASVLNPVDISGDALADRYAAAAEIILKTNQVDALVVILTPQVMTQIEKTAELIGDLKKYGKPIFCAFMGGSLIDQGEKRLNELKIPSFRFPERAINTIGIMWRWKKRQEEAKLQSTESTVIEINNDTAKGIIENAKKNNEKALDNFEANEILKSFGISTPATETAINLNQVKNFAEMNSWPVVLKLSSPGLLHKKDIGGVVTDISNNWQLEIVWDNYQRKITTLEPDVRDHVKLQIQKEIINGIEVIIGVKRDPVFGPVLLFGAGGSYAELIEDRNLHLLPVNLEQAKKLVDKSKIASILKGYRGQPAYALDKLYDCIVRLAKIIENNPDIAEIEINPLIVTLNNAWAVDGKVILKEGISKIISAPAFQIATTISHEILAAKFHYLVFEPEKPIMHKPGQYISVKVSNQRVNCYSIATSEGENRLGLLVDSKPGGVGSKFFENIDAGDRITYLGPFGTFEFKPDDGAKNILFLGTGSGAAPLRCMIDDMVKNNTFEKPLNFYFGLRFTTDVFWYDYFQKLSEKYPNIKYKLVLSQPDESWHGLTGHITDTAKADFPDASDCAAYLCGNKHMIDEATAVLLAAGCPKERIYSEKF